MEERKKLFIEPYSFFFHKIFCTLQIILKLRVKSHFHAIYLYKYKGFVILQVILRRVVWDTSQYVMQCFPRGINRMNIPTVTSSFFVSKCQAFVLRKIMLLMGDFRIYHLKSLHNYICSKCWSTCKSCMDCTLYRLKCIL